MSEVPVVPQTAPWPQRNEAPEDYSSMADAVGATLPTTIDGMNEAVDFINQRAVDADDSATAAAVSEGIATTKAGEASQSATAAQTYAASLESLDELWLGAATSDPATGKDGAPLVAGNAYVNSATGYLRAYNGTEWVQAVSAVSGVTSVNGLVGAVDGVLTEEGRQAVQSYTLASAAATENLDLAVSQVFRVDASAPRTLVFANEPGADRAMTVVAHITGSSAVTWPTGIEWDDGEVPQLGDNETKVVLFWDGVEWSGFARVAK